VVESLKFIFHNNGRIAEFRFCLPAFLFLAIKKTSIFYRRRLTDRRQILARSNFTSQTTKTNSAVRKLCLHMRKQYALYNAAGEPTDYFTQRGNKGIAEICKVS